MTDLLCLYLSFTSGNDRQADRTTVPCQAGKTHEAFGLSEQRKPLLNLFPVFIFPLLKIKCVFKTPQKQSIQYKS